MKCTLSMGKGGQFGSCVWRFAALVGGEEEARGILPEREQELKHSSKQDLRIAGCLASAV